MLNKFNFSKPAQNEDAPKHDRLLHGDCEIYGCPYSGHIQSEGRWNCRYHHSKAGKDLAHITTMLRNQSAEVDFYERLLSIKSYDFEAYSPITDTPYNYPQNDGESFLAYRNRLGSQIENMFRAKA